MTTRLLGGLQGTGLHGEIEPLAHGLASLLHRRKQAMADALQKTIDTIRGLIRAEDGSEVITLQIEEAQTRAERLRDLLSGLEIMAESVARAYEIETGQAFVPASGGRTNKTAHLTGAVFEAKAWIEAHEKEQADRTRVTGRPLAVAGDRDWMDHETIWNILDRARARYKDGYGEELVLYHKGDRKGVDAIAAGWAKARKVPQVIFKPNWGAHAKRAGFRAVDEMFRTPRTIGGVAIFGATGVAQYLAETAETKDIRVMRVARGPE